jgi:hypothetical protein
MCPRLMGYRFCKFYGWLTREQKDQLDVFYARVSADERFNLMGDTLLADPLYESNKDTGTERTSPQDLWDEFVKKLMGED